MNQSFKPGQIWLDTSGKPIQAHGFSVFYNDKDYCEKTKKYVAWLKIMCGTTSQFMSVMQADDFLGSYEFVHKMYKPLQMDTGDFALAVDETTKKGYFIFDRPHFEVITATLSDTYTEVTGEYSEHYVDLHPPFSRERRLFSKRAIKTTFLPAERRDITRIPARYVSLRTGTEPIRIWEIPA